MQIDREPQPLGGSIALQGQGSNRCRGFCSRSGHCFVVFRHSLCASRVFSFYWVCSYEKISFLLSRVLCTNVFRLLVVGEVGRKMSNWVRGICCGIRHWVALYMTVLARTLSPKSCFIDDCQGVIRACTVSLGRLFTLPSICQGTAVDWLAIVAIVNLCNLRFLSCTRFAFLIGIVMIYRLSMNFYHSS